MRIKSIILTIFLASTFIAAAQKENPDTIVGIFNPSNVTVITKANGEQVVTITITDSQENITDFQSVTKDIPSFFDLTIPKRWNLEKLFKKKPKRYNRSYVSTDFFKGLYAGGIIPISNSSSINNGWEIGLSSFVRGEVGMTGRGPSVSIGAGFGWEILNVDHGYILKKEDGRLLLDLAPEGSRNIRSKIKNFHFTVPITLNLPMSRKFGIGLVGELHLNTYTTASSSWETGDGYKLKSSIKGLHQRIATIDMKAILGWYNGIGIYVNYSPMHKWLEGYGPDYKTLSVGASLLF
ncbi:MAG: hypothetical protein HDR92_06945 [Bacteroides sp.]|nr:hypothetical protein [Bacteroides sp.]